MRAAGQGSSNLVLSLKVPSSTAVGPWFCRRAQRPCSVSSLKRNWDPAPGFLDGSPLVSASPPFPISSCLNLLFGIKGRSGKLSLFPADRKVGTHMNDSYLGGPHRVPSVLSASPWMVHLLWSMSLHPHCHPKSIVYRRAPS